MNNLLAQIVLAQRRFDGEGWMNILFVVVMAVLWMVGSIVKAMKTKADNQRQTGRSPARKQLDQNRGVQQQSPIQRTQRPAGPPQPAGQTTGVLADSPPKLSSLSRAIRRLRSPSQLRCRLNKQKQPQNLKSIARLLPKSSRSLPRSQDQAAGKTCLQKCPCHNNFPTLFQTTPIRKSSERQSCITKSLGRHCHYEIRRIEIPAFSSSIFLKGG